MRFERTPVFKVLATAVVASWLFPTPTALGQFFPNTGYANSIRRTRGTYGPGMSFGEFGARLNFSEAFGSPYGGLGAYGYGFGMGIGPGFGPNGALLYSSAYTAPGTNSFASGYYPPFASYGTNYQNPGVFGPGAPNWGGRPTTGPPPPPPAFAYGPPGRPGYVVIQPVWGTWQPRPVVVRRRRW